MPDQMTEREKEDHDKNLREAYAFAREERAQADTLLWEVSAIVWGGQTLLLGFVLEAISGSRSALLLIMFVAVIGVLMARFNEQISRKRSKVCGEMIQVMTDVEDKLNMPIKPQHLITSGYPARFQTGWSRKLNLSFLTVWVVVLLVAAYKLFYDFWPDFGLG